MRHEFYGTFKPGKKKSSNGLEVKKCFYNKGTRFFYMRKRSKSYRYFALYVGKNTKIICSNFFILIEKGIRFDPFCLRTNHPEKRDRHSG